MLIFAHIFAGALVGLWTRHLTNDRLVVPLCIAGSILPDLVDKPLGLLFPSVLGGGRTVFHSLIVIIFILAGMVVFLHSPIKGAAPGVTGAILLHQVFDEMWALPSTWFYPLLGPFQGQMIPGYIGAYFWLEITDPSEWMFLIATVMVLAEPSGCAALFFRNFRSGHLIKGAYTFFTVMFLGTGVYLVGAGLFSTTPTIITPAYIQVPVLMAGVLFLWGTVVLLGEKRQYPHDQLPGSR